LSFDVTIPLYRAFSSASTPYRTDLVRTRVFDLDAPLDRS
jgi:hypothetical protein